MGQKRLAEPDSRFRWDDLYNRVFSPSALHHKQSAFFVRGMTTQTAALQQSGAGGELPADGEARTSSASSSRFS
jgi:hypothetical protein